MQNPVCNRPRWLIALVLASATACSLDNSGLGPLNDASPGVGGTAQGGRSGGGQGGSAGSTGIAGTGIAGAGIAGISGIAGTTGLAGVGGGAGLPGASGATGAAGDGPAGAGGNVGVAGAGIAGGTAGAVVSGEAGHGGSAGATGGAASGGAGGRGGRGGSPGPGRGGAGANDCTSNSCPDCFRCGPMGCEPIPDSSWTVICRRATIAATKPNGAVWDAMMSGMSALPDVFCELKVDARSRSTSIDGDSLTPEWNDNVTPNSGELTSALLMSPQKRWSVTISDQDNSTASVDTICAVTPQLTGAELLAGTVTFSNVESCTELVLGFVCAD